MSQIALVAPVVSRGDAVGNDVLGMYHVLNDMGHDVTIYAGGWDLQEPKIQHFSKLKPVLSNKQAVLIYHFAIGWAPARDFLMKGVCRKVIRYHNVTPPEFFETIHPESALSCRSGRQQMSEIAKANFDLYLAASDFNATELINEGALPEYCMTVPPFHHIDLLEQVEADPEIKCLYQDEIKNILMVGRLSPNKRHDRLIHFFAHYKKYFNSGARLFIVGKSDPRLLAYTNRLTQQIAKEGLALNVILTGGVSEQALKAYYEIADLFVMTSDHEGFCVPLIEAMSMRIPVVAYGSSAIPATVGNGGIVWDDDDPLLFATSFDKLLSSSSTAQKLGNLGAARYKLHFTNEQIARSLIQAMEAVL